MDMQLHRRQQDNLQEVNGNGCTGSLGAQLLQACKMREEFAYDDFNMHCIDACDWVAIGSHFGVDIQQSSGTRHGHGARTTLRENLNRA